MEHGKILYDLYRYIAIISGGILIYVVVYTLIYMLFRRK